MGDDIAGVAAAVHNFLKQFVEIFQDNDLDGIVPAAEKVAIEFHDRGVGRAFDLLKPVIEGFDFLKIHSAAKAMNHFHHDIGRLIQQTDLPGKIHAMHMLWRKEEAFTEFLGGLWDAVKRITERLDVLAFKRGDEGGIDGVADPGGDFLVLAAGPGEFLEFDGTVERLTQLDECLDAVACLLRAGFQQLKKHVLFAQEPLK